MKTIKAKWDLFRFLGGEYPLPVRFLDARGQEHIGLVQSVEREDGSGHSFNVRIGTENGNNETFHFRTTD